MRGAWYSLQTLSISTFKRVEIGNLHTPSRRVTKPFNQHQIITVRTRHSISMASLTSATGEGCEYEKSVDVIHGGGGSTKSSPGTAVVDDGEIELDRSGNSSPDTAAIDGISSDALLRYERFVPWAEREAAVRRAEREAAALLRYKRFVPWAEREAAVHRAEREAALLRAELEWDALRRAEREDALRRAGLRRAEREAALHWAEWEDALRRLFSSVRRLAFSSAHLDTRLPTVLEYILETCGPFSSGSHSAFNGRRAFMEVETGNWETGRLITGVRFGRGLAELTPTSHDFRLEILDDDDVLETQAAITPSILVQQRSRLNQAIIIGLFMASELSATAFEIKYEESQMVAYFSMCTVCLMSAMYTARLLAPLEGGTERFNVYLRGCSFVFLGLLHLLGVSQGSLVTALKIFLGMSQVVLYWWNAGLLQTYMNAFGMRRT